MGIKILVLKDGCDTKLDEKMKRTRGCENCTSLGLGYITFRKSVSHSRRCLRGENINLGCSKGNKIYTHTHTQSRWMKSPRM